MSLAEHLRTLPAAELTALLRRRADVLVEPAPRDLAELTDRLTGVDSLSLALGTLDGDEVGVARVLAMTGPVPVEDLARAVGAPLPLVAAAVDRLTARALCWPHGRRLHLPAALAEHLAGDVLQFPPAAVLAGRSRVADLQAALRGLGGDPQGRKSDLAARLVELLGDPDVRQRAVAGLSPAGLRVLAATLSGAFLFGDPRGAHELRAAGLLLGDPYQGTVPREVAVDILLADAPPVTGPPELPAAAGAPADGRASAEAAVQAVTALLDEAVTAPLAALKKGGIGLRERRRLALRLGGLDPALAIDLAAAQRLLVAGPGGYAPSPAYASWRDAPLAQRWAGLARAWWDVEHHPTDRRDGDGEIPPPVPVVSDGGLLRRALLRAAAGGRSLDAAAAHVEWFCPLHGLDVPGRDEDWDGWDGEDPGGPDAAQVGAQVDALLAAAVATVRAEADALGVTSGDRLTELGERLVAGTLDELDDLLPEARGLLVLQSDLSAVVSGQADAAAVRVLTAAAVPEGRGAAVTWRFTPASVRAALDAGWSADELRAALVAAGGRALPQPLDYLIGDVARRHGSVRVRETRCCVTGTEAELSEILHTRALAKLELRRLAPTVLVTPAAPDAALAALRKAGFAPVPEDADGAVLVAARPADPSPTPAEAPTTDRAPLDADALAARLLTGPPAPPSATATRLGALNADLDTAEIAYLADALDHGRVVRIRYRNSAGNHSVRDIAPLELWDRFLRSHCLLRDGQRDFAVAGIEVVGPAR